VTLRDARPTTATLALALIAGAGLTCAGNPPPAPPPPPRWWTPPANPPPPKVNSAAPPEGATTLLVAANVGTGGGRPAARGDLGRCRIFPGDNAWNRDVSGDPVDPRSERYLRAMKADSKRLHPDFGSDPRYGIPWMTVGRGARRYEMEFSYADESDQGPYPFPADAPVEGGADAEGDRHVIVIDRDACKLYEGFNCWFQDTRWKCDSGAVFDLASNRLRPRGWTSADAAGLPVFAGLVRRDEVEAGVIRHALRFTVARTQRAFVHPATHFASPHRDPDLPPLGLRVRLKAGYDISRFHGAPRVILTALKRYGMILADNGADWFISGEANPRWNDDELAALKTVPASAFEVVKLGEIHR
jgi:hypothetical protein